MPDIARLFFSNTAGASRVLLLAFLPLTLIACTPTVQVAIPDKPIEINLNVKIEHEIRVKVDQELDELFEKDSTLF